MSEYPDSSAVWNIAKKARFSLIPFRVLSQELHNGEAGGKLGQ